MRDTNPRRPSIASFFADRYTVPPRGRSPFSSGPERLRAAPLVRGGVRCGPVADQAEAPIDRGMVLLVERRDREVDRRHTPIVTRLADSPASRSSNIEETGDRSTLSALPPRHDQLNRSNPDSPRGFWRLPAAGRQGLRRRLVPRRPHKARRRRLHPSKFNWKVPIGWKTTRSTVLCASHLTNALWPVLSLAKRRGQLSFKPRLTRRVHRAAALFGGVRRPFLRVILRRLKNRQSVPMATAPQEILLDLS
jgi:hypothetical protein